MPKLTKNLVESVKPNPKRDVFVWDTQLPGFGLRVYPSGRRKYVVFNTALEAIANAGRS